ncbi:hypothetical protein CMV_015543 [Castanea mollissima]|uniref:Late embryogenesis abundant protein LEA-2 subgroup domain-containing protein n=1 Tax=Castanea mollissima TaxID=60419 RepID=A0A8J4R9E9_9ROSI|nr:hypothetical protein CMV_015543 [Castanea mollissima]
MCEVKNFYLWLLQILALLGILALCLWLILRPKAPNYSIVDITIPPGSLASSEDQNATIYYDLEIENPNKDSSVYYDDVLFTFYYGQYTVGQKTIPSFHQGRSKTRQVVDYLEVKPSVWKSFRNAISNGKAELKASLLTKVRYKTWGQRSKHHKLDLRCVLDFSVSHPQPETQTRNPGGDSKAKAVALGLLAKMEIKPERSNSFLDRERACLRNRAPAKRTRKHHAGVDEPPRRSEHNRQGPPSPTLSSESTSEP